MTESDWIKHKARELWPNADAHRADIERALAEAQERVTGVPPEEAHALCLLTIAQLKDQLDCEFTVTTAGGAQ